MLSIERNFINYSCVLTSRTKQHYVLVAKENGINILLSYPNLFLGEISVSSKSTSNRYSSILALFYRFLSTEKKFEGVTVSQYHVVADNLDIKRWQAQRQLDRIEANKASPSSKTIYLDASILLIFFNWLHTKRIPTFVNVEKVTWKANFKNDDFLNYTRKKAKEFISSKNIKILDQESRQSELKTLITNNEISLLIESYTDPVYSALFKLALGTALRPMELVSFPFIGSGLNAHIMPYSEMTGVGQTCKYMVYKGKGNKTREIVINLADLKVLEDHYIQPYYYKRAKLFEQKYKQKCPPSILFLNSEGEPVTSEKISSRTYDAKKIAIQKDVTFRKKVTFYEARHWWPTMFLINTHKDNILTAAADVIAAAAAQALQNQMGHDSIETTYKYYIDRARVLTLAHKGYVNDIVCEPGESVLDFIARIEGRAGESFVQT